MNKFLRLRNLALICFVALAPPALPGQAAPDNSKVLGSWDVEIYAEGQYFNLILVMEEAEGKLAGTISEKLGMFTDTPLTNVRFDGTALAFEISVSSPPDGLVKTWAVEAAVGEEVMEGTISNAELGLSATLSAKRTKK
jgi:hypothetical protein